MLVLLDSGMWKQLVVTHGVLGVQVHDARLVALMMVQGISNVLTFNFADFSRYPKIVALTPSDVLKGVAAPPSSP